ncbi:MAG: PRC-barrel domain-containing protein [Actinomycetota bacterium]|nr:PRC-barrel domain-containing protein [Actinomycetota bacterium]
MSLLTQATALAGRPVVTLGGEDVGQVKDVVYSVSSRQVVGFTLAGRGLLAGPMRQALPWDGVHAVGRDAVMIPDEGVLIERDEVADRAELHNQNSLGGTVLTEGGTALGTIEDVILEIGGPADVVGYEIRTTEALPPAGRHAFLPLPGQVAASGEALVVPDAVATMVVDDLAALGALVRNERAGSEETR